MIRRETYAKYIASAQDVFQLAIAYYVANRDRPLDRADIDIAPPADLREAIVANEALRAEVVLLAGPSVRSAVRAYGQTLKQLWPSAASGTEFAPQTSTIAYHSLIETMHQEITEG